MKSLTSGEKELLRQKIREYHANRAVEIAGELEKPSGDGSISGSNIIKGWMEIIGSILELARNKKGSSR